MYKVIEIDTSAVLGEFLDLADAAALGRKLNAERRFQFCYIFKSGVGALDPKHC